MKNGNPKDTGNIGHKMRSEDGKTKQKYAIQKT